MRVNTFQRWNRKTVFPPRLARPRVATIINLTRNRTTSHVYTIARKFFPKVDKISSFFLPSFFPFFPTKNPLTIIRTRRREADYAFVAHRWMPNECRVSRATISRDRGRSLYTIENFCALQRDNNPRRTTRCTRGGPGRRRSSETKRKLAKWTPTRCRTPDARRGFAFSASL